MRNERCDVSTNCGKAGNEERLGVVRAPVKGNALELWAEVRVGCSEGGRGQNGRERRKTGRMSNDFKVKCALCHSVVLVSAILGFVGRRGGARSGRKACVRIRELL